MLKAAQRDERGEREGGRDRDRGERDDRDKERGDRDRDGSRRRQRDQSEKREPVERRPPSSFWTPYLIKRFMNRSRRKNNYHQFGDLIEENRDECKKLKAKIQSLQKDAVKQRKHQDTVTLEYTKLKI